MISKVTLIATDTILGLKRAHKRLEEERKRRFLDSIPETIRMLLSEYLSSSK